MMHADNLRSSASISKKTSSNFDILIPVTAVVITIVLFSAPIVVYYTRSYWNNDGESSNLSLAVNLTHCYSPSLLSWGERSSSNSGHCTNVPYRGTVCNHVLDSWQRCTGIGDDKTLYVYFNDSIDTRDQQIINFNTFLIHDKACQKAAFPFLCKYQFPLHDCTGGVIYLASREDCIDISTGQCSKLWSLAIRLGYSDILPSCQDLPPQATFTNRSEIQGGDNTTSEITCHSDFILVNSTCIPSCDKFEEHSHTESLLLIHSEWIFSLAALLESIVILILLLKNYKEMFVSPSLLIFFEIIDCFIIAFLVFTMSAKRFSLMCTSDNSLLHSLQNPTPFCILSGALFHYAIVNLPVLALIHVSIFFYKVVFPYHAQRMAKMGRDKYVYWTTTLFGLAFPLPAIIICLTVDKHKYHIVRFPPTVCLSIGDIFFYSVTIVIDTVTLIGMTLLIIVFWVIHKRNSFKTQLSTAEKKIILIFVSILILALTILAYTSHVSATANKFKMALAEYFQCEAFGYEPGKCDHSYDGIVSPYWSMTVYGMVGFVPISVLNYVLNWESIKNCCTKLLCAKRNNMKNPQQNNCTSNSQKHQRTPVQIPSNSNSHSCSKEPVVTISPLDKASVPIIISSASIRVNCDVSTPERNKVSDDTRNNNNVDSDEEYNNTGNNNCV